jgi:hypothetical protein
MMRGRASASALGGVLILLTRFDLVQVGTIDYNVTTLAQSLR